MPPTGYYEVTAAKDKIVRMGDRIIKNDERAKSFHVDTYCFDSGSERQLFWDLVREQRVKKIYFTGMLTHGQSDFFIQYIDPDSRTVRSYYPDFIARIRAGDGGGDSGTRSQFGTARIGSCPRMPTHVIVEVTGAKRDKPAKVDTARNLWVPAINNHGGFGRWAFVEITDPWADAAEEIRGVV